MGIAEKVKRIFRQGKTAPRKQRRLLRGQLNKLTRLAGLSDELRDSIEREFDRRCN